MRVKRIAIVLFAATAATLAGCTAMTAGQLVQAGYDAASTSLAGSPASPADAQHAKSVMNAINVGQETAPIIASMGMPPKEKSGNPQGYTCYEYAAVYSPTEDAVIVSKDGKVVFFGNSTCRVEMQNANFKDGGKYAGGAGAGVGDVPPAGTDSGAGPATSPDAGTATSPGPASDSTDAGSGQGSSPASGQGPASQ